MDWLNRTHIGDCRALLRAMAADGVRVQCVVTSPPYWGLRDYGTSGQFGLERTWVRHVARMRGVFRLVREVLADDGTLWMNYGDSYAGSPGGGQGKNGQRASRRFTAKIGFHKRGPGIKPKDLVGMPWRVALALQADGWYLRSEIIWHKPNPMPESVNDRPTKAHEHLFLLARSDIYYYDANAIREPAKAAGPAIAGWASGPGSHRVKDHARVKQGLRDSTKFGRGAGWRTKQNASSSTSVANVVPYRNIHTVWTIPTEPFSGAHFATFPQKLAACCILAGSRPGDVVLDPFMGSGTIGKVATDLGRNFIGLELSAEYVEMHKLRRTTIGMPI